MSRKRYWVPKHHLYSEVIVLTHDNMEEYVSDECFKLPNEGDICVKGRGIMSPHRFKEDYVEVFLHDCQDCKAAQEFILTLDLMKTIEDMSVDLDEEEPKEISHLEQEEAWREIRTRTDECIKVVLERTERFLEVYDLAEILKLDLEQFWRGSLSDNTLCFVAEVKGEGKLLFRTCCWLNVGG